MQKATGYTEQNISLYLCFTPQNEFHAEIT